MIRDPQIRSQRELQVENMFRAVSNRCARIRKKRRAVEKQHDCHEIADVWAERDTYQVHLKRVQVTCNGHRPKTDSPEHLKDSQWERRVNCLLAIAGRQGGMECTRVSFSQEKANRKQMRQEAQSHPVQFTGKK